jgi:hypothetical protein
MNGSIRVYQSQIISNDTDGILEHVIKAEYGAHYLLIHPELNSLRELYSTSIKTKLKDNNEIVLILTYYEPPDNLRKILSNTIDDLRKYENEGSLIIMDSLKGYFGLDSRGLGIDIGAGNSNNDTRNSNNNDTVNALMRLLEEVIKRAESLGKNGVSVFADMASFYHYSSINTGAKSSAAVDKLIEHELSLPSKYNLNLKAFCIYHKADFDKRLSQEQRQKLLNHHGKGLMIITTTDQHHTS